MIFRILLLLILSGCIISEALFESLFDKNLKLESKRMQFLNICFWFSLAAFVHYLEVRRVLNIPAAYLALRYLLFDISYNLNRGLKWYYAGTTSGLYSRIMRDIKHYLPLYIFTLLMACTLAAFWIFRDLQIN